MHLQADLPIEISDNAELERNQTNSRSSSHTNIELSAPTITDRTPITTSLNQSNFADIKGLMMNVALAAGGVAVTVFILDRYKHDVYQCIDKMVKFFSRASK